jgi:hypothetical protein
MKFNLLVDSEMIINFDLGILHLIRKSYRNTDVFNIPYLDNTPDKVMRNDLITSPSPNPLSLIIRKKTVNIDKLYEDFRNEDLKRHCELTGFGIIAAQFYSKPDHINMVCLVHNDSQADYVSNLKFITDTVRPGEVDKDAFDSIYVCKMGSLGKMGFVPEGMHIYMAKTLYNLPKDEKERSLYLLLSSANEFKLVDLYNREYLDVPDDGIDLNELEEEEKNVKQHSQQEDTEEITEGGAR